MLGYVVNTLLTHKHISSALDYLVHHALQHSFLFIEECLDLVRTVNLDLSVELGLLNLNCRVDQSNLGFLYPPGHCCMNDLFVNHHAVYKLGFGEALALLLDYLDHLDVSLHAAVGSFAYLQNCIHSNLREVLLCADDRLAVH